MHSFLDNIASAYAHEPEVQSYAFVFPNVRSKRYFTSRLVADGIDEHKAERMCLTLVELIEKGSGLTRISGDRLVFLLYQAYCDVSTKLADKAPKIQEFDRFRYWAQIILNDFNDVDSYMANPDEVFRNATDYKKIQSLYLTEAQRQIIESYWGTDPFWNEPAVAGTEELPFWNHVSPQNETDKKFTRLWAILGQVYTRFRELLGNECYPGLAARTVAEKLRAGNDLRPFNPKLFVFIGFNRLTSAEHIILEELDKRGQAHFYWDYDPSLMAHGDGNIASRFIAKYVERFTASLPGVQPPVRPLKHKVDVIGVPSAVAQAKIAAQILDSEESAVILPSDDMLLPMVASIPERFKNVNVTMGYPLRYSALAQLFSLLNSLQSHATIKEDGPVFFRDDVRQLITNPLIQSVYVKECRYVEDYMRKRNLFNLPANKITQDFGRLTTFLVALQPNDSLDNISAYIRSALTQLKDDGAITGMDAKCLDTIMKMINTISKLATECLVTMNTATFFRIIERTIFQRSLPLEGETFDALQVMGLLETRALSFSNVVMLSMNDAVFPGHDVKRSFIPEALRRAYGLPTRDHHSVDAAYLFYHILSAAEHLTLIYDSRSGGLKSGEMSRFIYQLQYLNFPGVEITLRNTTIGATTPNTSVPIIAPGIEIPKTPRIMAKLDRYRDPNLCNKFSLSASALKEYVSCPVKFLFQRVENINPPDPQSETMTAADYGNVIHSAAENIYESLKSMHNGLITNTMLEDLIDGKFDNLLERELDKSINIHLNKVPQEIEGQPNPAVYQPIVEGEAAVYRDVLLPMLKNLFKRDCHHTPFTMIATEADETFCWNIQDDISVNFTMKIDRIDQINRDGENVTRLVDYKTGGDKNEFHNIAQLLTLCNPDHPGAIFQLFTYSLAYSDQKGLDPKFIMPQIYKLKGLQDEAFTPIYLKLGKNLKNAVTDFKPFADEFRKGLANMLRDLFNPQIPFVRASDDKCCTYCKFYSFCHNRQQQTKRF